MNRRNFLSLMMLSLASCTRTRREKNAVHLPKEELPWLWCLAVEGSLFHDHGVRDHVWKAIAKLKNSFFRNVESGKIVLARIWDSPDAIQWKGDQKSWRRDVGSFNAFDRKVLGGWERHGTRLYPSGTRVYANLADCAEYLTLRHEESAVERSGFIFFSRGEDKSATPAADRDRLVSSLRKYLAVSKGGCLLGGYWMERHSAQKLRDIFREGGFTNCRTEDQTDPDPPMPSWES